MSNEVIEQLVGFFILWPNLRLNLRNFTFPFIRKAKIVHCVVDKISILRLLSAALLQPKKSRFDRKWPLISGWCIFESFPPKKKDLLSFTYPI